MATDSTFRRDLVRLMSQVDDTLRSVRVLTDYLEQHPESPDPRQDRRVMMVLIPRMRHGLFGAEVDFAGARPPSQPSMRTISRWIPNMLRVYRRGVPTPIGAISD